MNEDINMNEDRETNVTLSAPTGAFGNQQRFFHIRVIDGALSPAMRYI